MIYDVTVEKGEGRLYFTIDDCKNFKEAFVKIDELLERQHNTVGVVIKINVR